MEYKIKSLNCNSCGASLIKKINSNLCKCRYCGNSNIILEDGTTKIHFDEITKESSVTKKEQPVLNIWIIALLGFVSVFLMGYFLHKRHKQKDKKVYEKGGKTQYT